MIIDTSRASRSLFFCSSERPEKRCKLRELDRFDKKSGRPVLSIAVSAALIASSSATPILTRLCLVDRQAASAVFLVVQGVYGCKSIGVGHHFDEAEATAPARLPILDHLRTSHLAKRREQVFQVSIRDRERKITDV